MTSTQLRGRRVVGWAIPDAVTEAGSISDTPSDQAATRILPALQVHSAPRAATLPFLVVARPRLYESSEGFSDYSDHSFEAVRVAAIGPRVPPLWWALGLVAGAASAGAAAAAFLQAF